jgi:hypothetical protein
MRILLNVLNDHTRTKYLIAHYVAYTILEYIIFLGGIVARDDLNKNFLLRHNLASKADLDDLSASFSQKYRSTNSKIEARLRKLRQISFED